MLQNALKKLLVRELKNLRIFCILEEYIKKLQDFESIDTENVTYSLSKICKYKEIG